MGKGRTWARGVGEQGLGGMLSLAGARARRKGRGSAGDPGRLADFCQTKPGHRSVLGHGLPLPFPQEKVVGIFSFVLIPQLVLGIFSISVILGLFPRSEGETKSAERQTLGIVRLHVATD